MVAGSGRAEPGSQWPNVPEPIRRGARVLSRDFAVPAALVEGCQSWRMSYNGTFFFTVNCRYVALALSTHVSGGLPHLAQPSASLTEGLTGSVNESRCGFWINEGDASTCEAREELEAR